MAEIDPIALARAISEAEQSPVATRPSAVQQYQEMGFTNFIAKYNDGQILENPQTGERVFTSPGYNTTNPEIISNMMQGTSPAETGSAQIQEQIIEQYPVASRAATALQGVPFIGSYTDEAVGMFNPQAGEAMRQSVEAVRRNVPVRLLPLRLVAQLLQLLR
jgi:hypothetical protein